MSDKYDGASGGTRADSAENSDVFDDRADVVTNEDGAPEGGDDELSRQGDGQGNQGAGSEHNWEKRFKDTQAKLTEVSKAKAELEKRLAVLEGKLEVLANERTHQAADNREDPLSFLEDESFDEKFLEKPREGLKHVINVLGTALVNMDRRYKQQIEALVTEMRKPSGEVAEAIRSLRDDPDFAGFSDEQLALLVKKGVVGRSAGKREYPGGNTTARRADPSTVSDAELERQTRAIFKKLYGEEV